MNKRDELAEKYAEVRVSNMNGREVIFADDARTLMNNPRAKMDHFKAGWDACLEHSEELKTHGDVVRDCIATHKENQKLNKIQREMFGPAGQKHIGELMDERDRLKAALKEIESDIIHNPVYSSQLAIVRFNSIVEKALGEK